MNVQQAQKKLDSLKEECKYVEHQIGTLAHRKSSMEAEIRECETVLERAKNFDMAQEHYFKSIEKLSVTEGAFTIKIGGFYGNGMYVATTEGDKTVYIGGRFDTVDDELHVSRDETREKRSYYRRYFAQEIPQKYEEVYSKLIELKRKYGTMMANGEIKPKQTAE
ncbi:hypothetical protein [Bacillus thuringiensis]|uniref:hypothetical protein n=1 Tax=Bacillus thuringiensis TaxID=1428 RepID=UPI000BFC8D89|nr:hypothetical protein [Bacillus thuringiensis]PGT89862.1 hypothetical protein COD17_08925 [Bacillus thuringiensis]